MAKKWIAHALHKTHKGKFTKYCKSAGYPGVTPGCISHGIHSKKREVRGMAIFAKNAKHFKH